MITFSNKDTLWRSFQEANRIMQLRAVSFYQAFSKLGQESFASVTAVYAYCRYADDLVDCSASSVDALALLNDLESAVRKIYMPNAQNAGEALPEAWWPCFVYTVQKYGIDQESLLMQIQGQRMDANFKAPQTLEDFLQYCRLVAGSVGRMLVPILLMEHKDAQNPKFLSACEDLGVAMQITNILRDVGEDLRLRDRLYLPADLMKQFQVERSVLVALSNVPADKTVRDIIPENFIALWEYLSKLADGYYRPVTLWISSFHPKSRLPLLMAANSYQAIAQAVREEGYNCFTKRCYTDKETRSGILKNLVKSLQNSHALIAGRPNSEVAHE